MTLNDFEWLEWPFYVKFPLLRTALSAIRLHVQSVYTRDQQRCADVRIADRDRQNIWNPRNPRKNCGSFVDGRRCIVGTLDFPLTPKTCDLE